MPKVSKGFSVIDLVSIDTIFLGFWGFFEIKFVRLCNLRHHANIVAFST